MNCLFSVVVVLLAYNFSSFVVTGTVITTIAGTGTKSYSGDDGAATSATLYDPGGIVLDSTGNVYTATYYDHRVRKVTISTGIITTYVGTGSSGYSGDGSQASSAKLRYPHGLCIDTSGNEYIFSIYIYDF